jgi:hypothetical protein
VASFDVYDDLYAYATGVYVRSAAAKKVGAHAVTLIGWGEPPPPPLAAPPAAIQLSRGRAPLASLVLVVAGQPNTHYAHRPG